MNIPTKIKIGDAWYEINIVKTMDTPSAMGSTNYRARCIKVATHSKHGTARKTSTRPSGTRLHTPYCMI
jgi:hypothetical protein